jgi:hypothetical protein
MTKLLGLHEQFCSRFILCVTRLNLRMAIFRNLCKTNTRFFWHPHCTVSVKYDLKTVKPEKGKPLERVGRKATGLSPCELAG